MSKKKPKPGRPLESPLARDHLIAIRLNKHELDCLEGYCERYDTSISDVVRDALMLLSVIPSNPNRM